jgi:hypothetical protein
MSPINLPKAFAFKLLCLFIKVIESFAKSFSFFGVLSIGHDYQNLHQN